MSPEPAGVRRGVDVGSVVPVPVRRGVDVTVSLPVVRRGVDWPVLPVPVPVPVPLPVPVPVVVDGLEVPGLTVVSFTTMVSVRVITVSVRGVRVVSNEVFEEVSAPVAPVSTAMTESRTVGSSFFVPQAARPKATRHPAIINGREFMM